MEIASPVSAFSSFFFFLVKDELIVKPVFLSLPESHQQRLLFYGGVALIDTVLCAGKTNYVKMFFMICL